MIFIEQHSRAGRRSTRRIGMLIALSNRHVGVPTSGVHPNPEGNPMNTRHASSVVLAAVVSVLVLAPWRGAAWPPETALEPIPVEGRLSPDGRFDGTLM